MALDVRFLKGSLAEYQAATKSSTTFYLVDNSDLYLGEVKLSNGADLNAAVARIAVNEQGIKDINTELDKLTGGAEVEGSIAKAIADAVQPINDKIGTADLTTTSKTLTEAINELKVAIGTGGTSAAVTLTKDESNPDYAAVYTLAQGGNTVGEINIPKDMVVKSGTVEVDPEGQAEGTYLVITLANATEDKIYINVGTLVDIYTVKGDAAQVQLAMNGREISASIVAGSIGTAEIADGAILTAKIANENVTLEKLSAEVKASLSKADASVAKADYEAAIEEIEGNINTNAGAIATLEGKVDVEKVSSAIATAKSEAISTAETKATELVAAEKADREAAEETMAGKIATLESAVGEGGSVGTQIDAKINALNATVSSEAKTAGNGIQISVAEEKGKLTSVTVSGDYSELYDAKGAANTALTNAKAYADGLAANYDKAGSAAVAESNAKKYTDDQILTLDADVTSATVEEGKGIRVQVTEVDGKVNNVVVTGNYDESYDAKGAASAAQTAAATDAQTKADKALADAKTYADGLATQYDAAGSASSALATAKTYAEGEADAAEAAAKAYTDGALTWGTIA